MQTCEVTLEDNRLGIWTFCNNWFTRVPGEPLSSLSDWYWSGVAILLGLGEGLDGSPFKEFTKIELHGSNGNFSVDKDKFNDALMWINVWAQTTRGSIRPMEPEHLPLMKLAHLSSLRENFRPYSGLITLWAESGLEIEFIPGSQHVFFKHKFTLAKDEIVIAEIYEHGNLLETLENVTQVSILAGGELPPGPLKGPPA